MKPTVICGSLVNTKASTVIQAWGSGRTAQDRVLVCSYDCLRANADSFDGLLQPPPPLRSP